MVRFPTRLTPAKAVSGVRRTRIRAGTPLGVEAADREADPLGLVPVRIALPNGGLDARDDFVGCDPSVGLPEGLLAQQLVVRAGIGDHAHVADLSVAGHDLSEITLFDSTGLALQDLAIAKAAFAKVSKLDLPTLDL